MNKIQTLEDYIKYTDKIPYCIINEVNCKLTNWLNRGRKIEDIYVKKQFEYAERYLAD